MIWEWVFIVLPIAFFCWKAFRSRYSLAYLVVGLYVYPFYALTALSSGGFAIPGLQLSLDTVNALRVGVHGLFFMTLCTRLLLSRSGIRVPRAFVWASIAIMGMLVSLLVNGSPTSALVRVLGNCMMLVNLFLLVPSLAKPDNYFQLLSKASVLLAFYLSSLSAYTIWQYGFWPEWSLRLGRPWNPGVLSNLLAIAFLVSFVANISSFLQSLLLILIFLAAARTDIAIVLLFYMHVVLTGKRPRLAMLGLLVALILVMTVVYTQFLLDFPSNWQPFARGGLLSGREVAWRQGIDILATSPWFGIGDRAYIERLSGTIEGPQRVHNMLLEMAMSYGLPISLVAFMVYVSIARRIYKLWRAKRVFPSMQTTVCLGLVALTLAHISFGGAYWTNLGDGTATLMLAFIVPMAAYAKRSRRADHFKGPEPHRHPLSRLESKVAP